MRYEHRYFSSEVSGIVTGRRPRRGELVFATFERQQVPLFALSTGKAAGELAERGGGVDAVLANHEALASKTKIMFAGLSALLLGIFWLPRILRRPETRLNSTLLPLTYLAVYSVGVLFLVNTAHTGGRLVHEFGVHSMLSAVAGQPPALTPPLSVEK